MWKYILTWNNQLIALIQIPQLNYTYKYDFKGHLMKILLILTLTQ